MTASQSNRILYLRSMVGIVALCAMIVAGLAFVGVAVSNLWSIGGWGWSNLGFASLACLAFRQAATLALQVGTARDGGIFELMPQFGRRSTKTSGRRRINLDNCKEEEVHHRDG